MLCAVTVVVGCFCHCCRSVLLVCVVVCWLVLLLSFMLCIAVSRLLLLLVLFLCGVVCCLSLLPFAASLLVLVLNCLLFVAVAGVVAGVIVCCCRWCSLLFVRCCRFCCVGVVRC